MRRYGYLLTAPLEACPHTVVLQSVLRLGGLGVKAEAW
jgi:hypothetical protein